MIKIVILPPLIKREAVFLCSFSDLLQKFPKAVKRLETLRETRYSFRVGSIITLDNTV